MIKIFYWIIFVTMKNKSKSVAFRWNSHAIMAV